MRFNKKRSVQKLISKANRNSMNALALAGSMLAFSLQPIMAQEGNSPIRIHAAPGAATPASAISSYAPGNWPVQPAVSPMLNGIDNGLPYSGSAVRFSAHEDFSVPTAAAPSLLPKHDAATVSVSPASDSSQLFKTVSTSKILASVNSQASGPAPVSEVISGPVVSGPEVIVDGDYPIMQDPMYASNPQYYSGMPYAASSPQFGGGGPNNIGYDPTSMIGCARENCRLYYFSAEALYWKQEEDQSLGFTQRRNLSDFDYEWGGRVTLGEMLDCINGWEFVYTGPFEWNRTLDVTGPGLNSSFRTLAPLPTAPALLDTFFNANVQSQSLQTKLSTYEVNRRWFATDLFSTLIGMRFASYNENFNFSSVGPNGFGLFTNRTTNFLIGAQVGVNMYRPVTQRLSYGGWGKAGVYANFAKNKNLLQNNNDFIIDNSQRSDTSVAGILQGGLSLRYQILPRLVLSGGYEAMFIPGVATVANQQTFPLTETSPNRVDQDDSVFFHGANAGFEYSY